MSRKGKYVETKSKLMKAWAGCVNSERLCKWAQGSLKSNRNVLKLVCGDGRTTFYIYQNHCTLKMN